MDMQVDLPEDNSLEKPNGLTPLHMAAIEGNLAGICLTLEHLPDLLGMTGSTGPTALRWAVTPGHEEVVKELLNANAKLWDYHEPSLLHRAAYARQGGIVKLIVQALSSEYHPLPKEENVRNLLVAVINRDNDSIRHILKEGSVNLHVRDNDLGATLSWAIKYRDIKLVEQLLARSADINIESDLTGGTALHDAVDLSCYEIVTALVENGARINVKDYSESTPLDIAVTQDDARITKLLLANGANIDGNFGRSALRSAREYGQLHLIHLLALHGVTVDNFMFGNAIFDEETTDEEQERVRILLELYFKS